MTRIAFIHATRVAIDPIDSAARAIWPEAETISILDEGLSVDRAATRNLTPDLSRRINDLAQYAAAAHADAVLFTCSAFGSAIEAADAAAAIPVMKPNEAMFDAAFGYGDRIAMIYTFRPAAQGLEEEFATTASKRGRAARLVSYFCDNALEAKRRGNDAEHDRLIADTAADIQDADVILLAQFSMARAADLVRLATSLPVLTSPEAAMKEIRTRVEGGS